MHSEQLQGDSRHLQGSLTAGWPDRTSDETWATAVPTRNESCYCKGCLYCLYYVLFIGYYKYFMPILYYFLRIIFLENSIGFWSIPTLFAWSACAVVVGYHPKEQIKPKIKHAKKHSSCAIFCFKLQFWFKAFCRLSSRASQCPSCLWMVPWKHKGRSFSMGSRVGLSHNEATSYQPHSGSAWTLV